MSAERQVFATARRVVIKIGSSSLTSGGQGLSDEAVDALVRTVSSAMAADRHTRKTMGEDGCARRNDATSFFAAHENQEAHGGDQADPGRIDGDARPLHDIDDRKPFRAASSMAIDDHLNMVDFTGHIDFNDFFTD